MAVVLLRSGAPRGDQKFLIVEALRAVQDLPRRPASFKEGCDITALSSQEIEEALRDELQLDAAAILEMGGRSPDNHENLVQLADLAIRSANDGARESQGTAGCTEGQSEGAAATEPARKRCREEQVTKGEAPKKAGWFYIRM